MFNDSWTSYKIEAPEDNSVITINGVELTADNSNVIYNSLVLDSNNYNIVTLHGQEAMSSSKDKTEVISLKELKNKAIDYLALGHIHSYKMEQLDSRGVYCYPGCLEGRGFDECGEHGFVLLDIKDNKLVGNEFISVSYRNLYEEDVDISECMNSVEMAEKVREVLYKKDYASASLIKVVLTGQIDINAEKNLTYITENFKNDYYYFKLYDHTSIKVDYSSYQYDKSLKGEVVRLVESDDTLDDITKASIIKIGIDALSGEEFI